MTAAALKITSICILMIAIQDFYQCRLTVLEHKWSWNTQIENSSMVALLTLLSKEMPATLPYFSMHQLRLTVTFAEHSFVENNNSACIKIHLQKAALLFKTGSSTYPTAALGSLWRNWSNGEKPLPSHELDKETKERKLWNHSRCFAHLRS